MNVPLLLEVCDRISKHPENFSMWTFISRDKTVGCIAGLVFLMRGGDYPGSVKNRARELLELDCAETERLFYVDYWPELFRRAYKESRAERAEIAVRRIHHFIQTEGRE